ncbi:YraN family protein [bacterium]|nr:MAG: YraN family protein [bacterium]
MTEKEKIGKIGENLSVKYLKKNGYKILQRNFKQLPWGEIDIITKKDNYLVFIEVKTLTAQSTLYLAENKIGPHKKRALLRVIQIYLNRKRLALDCLWQVDAIFIKLDFPNRKFKLKHLENIFY